MAYTFTMDQKARFKKQGEGQASWTTATPQNASKKDVTIESVAVEIWAPNSEPNQVKTNKETALKAAFKALKKAGLLWTTGDVKKTRVVFYGGDGTTLPSRGAVYFENTSDLKPCILLQLGNRLSKHVTVDSSTSQSMAGSDGTTMIAVAGGVRGRPPRVVADRIYDYYKPTITVGAKERCALAQSLHELGHIVHQLTKPADYWLNADVAGGDNNAKQQRLAQFSAIKDYGLKYVSNYAGTDAKSLNEYVAEVFCGLLMGIPWGTIDNTGNLMQTYDDLGGPLPTNMPESISRVNDFKTVKCNCTANDHNEAFKYW